MAEGFLRSVLKDFAYLERSIGDVWNCTFLIFSYDFVNSFWFRILQSTMVFESLSNYLRYSTKSSLKQHDWSLRVSESTIVVTGQKRQLLRGIWWRDPNTSHSTENRTLEQPVKFEKDRKEEKILKSSETPVPEITDSFVYFCWIVGV